MSTRGEGSEGSEGGEFVSCVHACPCGAWQVDIASEPRGFDPFTPPGAMIGWLEAAVDDVIRAHGRECAVLGTLMRIEFDRTCRANAAFN